VTSAREVGEGVGTVLIATPSHDGTVCCDYAIAMAEIFRQAQDRGYNLNLEFWMYESLIQKARNNLLALEALTAA